MVGRQPSITHHNMCVSLVCAPFIWCSETRFSNTCLCRIVQRWAPLILAAPAELRYEVLTLCGSLIHFMSSLFLCIHMHIPYTDHTVIVLPCIKWHFSFLLFPQALLLLQFVAQSLTGCMFTVVSSSLYKTRQKYVRLNTVEFLLKWRFDSNPEAPKLCCTYCLIKHLQSRFLERFETYIVHIHHCLLAVLICPFFVGALLLQCLAPNCTNCRSVAIVLKLLAR